MAKQASERLRQKKDAVKKLRASQQGSPTADSAPPTPAEAQSGEDESP